MAKASMQLDPNAQAYTDDEVVGKVNAATTNITRSNAVESSAVDLSGKSADDLAESATKKWAGASGADFIKSTDTLDDVVEGTIKKHFTATEQTKLTGIEESAKDDQGGAEIRDLIVALADNDRKLVISDPQTGEFKIIAVQRDADGKLDVDYENIAV